MSGQVEDLELPVAQVDDIVLGDEACRRRTPQAVTSRIETLVREGVDQQFVEGRIAGIDEQLAKRRRDIAASQRHDPGREFHVAGFSRMYPAMLEFVDGANVVD